MSAIPPIKQSRPSKVLYVGVDRCERLRRCSVEVSYHSGLIINAAKFTQYLIDNYQEKAKLSLIKELNKNKQSRLNVVTKKEPEGG